MNLEEFRNYCLAKPHTSEDFPFNETTLVLRVANKIFAMTDVIDQPFRFNLKCDPEWAVDLREQYESIIPGYHCNKKHWNTIYPDDSLDLKLIQKMIDLSYQLIINSLPKKIKDSLN